MYNQHPPESYAKPPVPAFNHPQTDLYNPLPVAPAKSSGQIQTLSEPTQRYRIPFVKKKRVIILPFFFNLQISVLGIVGALIQPQPLEFWWALLSGFALFVLTIATCIDSLCCERLRLLKIFIAVQYPIFLAGAVAVTVLVVNEIRHPKEGQQSETIFILLIPYAILGILLLGFILVLKSLAKEIEKKNAIGQGDASCFSKLTEQQQN